MMTNSLCGSCRVTSVDPLESRNEDNLPGLSVRGTAGAAFSGARSRGIVGV